MLSEYYKAATKGAAITELDLFGIVKLTWKRPRFLAARHDHERRG
jgi:hypothetical protein